MSIRIIRAGWCWCCDGVRGLVLASEGADWMVGLLMGSELGTEWVHDSRLRVQVCVCVCRCAVCLALGSRVARSGLCLCREVHAPAQTEQRCCGVTGRGLGHGLCARGVAAVACAGGLSLGLLKGKTV